MVHEPAPPTKATKAWFALGTSLAAGIATVFADGKVGVAECATAAGGVLVIVGSVYGVTNDPKQETQVS